MFIIIIILWKEHLSSIYVSVTTTFLTYPGEFGDMNCRLAHVITI